jgi:hypothetical protein
MSVVRSGREHAFHLLSWCILYWAVEIRVDGGFWLSRGFSLGELRFHAPRDIVRKSEEGLSRVGCVGLGLE